MSRLTYGKAAYVGKAFFNELKDMNVSPHLDSRWMTSRPIAGLIKKRASRPATVNSFHTLCSHNHDRNQIYSLFHMPGKVPAAGMLFSGGEW